MILHFSKIEHSLIRPLGAMRINGVLTDIKDNLKIATILVNHYYGKETDDLSDDTFIKEWYWDSFYWFAKAHGHDVVISVDYSKGV